MKSTLASLPIVEKSRLDRFHRRPAESKKKVSHPNPWRLLMKKSLLALAVLGAFAGAAQAQSSVQIYGSFDGGVRHVTDVDAAGNNQLTMGSTGTYNSNRIGFKGVEDLGGGLNAHFNLETGFNTGTGRLNNTDNRLFERTASVGLGGAWGNLDFGRQYTVAFRTVSVYDPFNYKYTGIASAIAATAGTRADNNIQYYGTFGAVTARAEYALGESTAGVSTGAKQAVGATFVTGPLSLGAAYTQRNDLTGVGLDNQHWTVGGAYSFGPARVAVGYQTDDQDVTGVADTQTERAWVGGSFAITPAVELTAAYYRTEVDAAATADGKKDLYMIGATYALSKRTNFYAEADFAKLDGSQRLTAAPNQDSQRGISVGINHLF
jgi:predicted porin